jgi:hypothetical protein
MKYKILLLVVFAATHSGNFATAQTTIVNVTGSTSFRGTAANAIRASFSPGVEYGYTGTSFPGATQHIFKGGFPGIAGTTIVRTFWGGSSEGARSVLFDLTNPYLPTTATISTGGTQNLPSGTVQDTSNLYFSDVDVTKTVYGTFDPRTLPLPDPIAETTQVGAVVFTMIKNEMASTNPKFASYNNFTNISAQQFRSLFGLDNSGRMLLSQLTGVSGDSDTTVYATGRNDFSGARTLCMLESGYGPENPVIQWKMFSNAANVITTIQLWPINDVPNATTDNRSLQWPLADTSLPDSPPFPQGGIEQDANGGYFSGGALSAQLDDTSESVDLADETGAVFASGQNVILVSYLANADAANAIAGGAKALSYNGYGITPSNPLSAVDKAKITKGQYTLWSFEQFVRSQDSTGTAAETVYDAVLTNIPANIGGDGLSMTEMVGVIRSTDGGNVVRGIP